MLDLSTPQGHPGRASVAAGWRRRRPAARRAVDRPIYRSGHVYLACTVALLLGWLLVLQLESASRLVQEADRAVVGWLTDQRDPTIARALEDPTDLVSSWLWRLLRWGTLAVLLATRRFRHLVVYCGVVLAVSAVTNLAVDVGTRRSPPGADPVVDPTAVVHPSWAMVALGLSAVGAMYTLLPRGRARNRAKVVTGAVVVVVAGARLYLALDDPTGIAVAAVVGMAVPVVAFRYLTPNEAFPIRYGRRPAGTALDEPRETSIRAALEEELGWSVDSIELLRPAGSAGSTPMRVAVRRPAGPAVVFGKLYSLAHLRSDRWYKLARAVLYGRLEDEAPFADIRHLVEHEDYMLRVAADGGLPVPVTHGVIEVVPGREYLLLMEWIPDAQQLDARIVTDAVVDQGFAAVAQMWRVGLAHRDIKPANLVVAGGRLYVVDLSFAELRASPWRQAVDLGVMTLCLALYAGPRRALSIGRSRFTADELAEGLAAARAVTIPAQLRAALRERERDVVAECRRLVPEHGPIRVQRWSLARIVLTAASALMTAVALALLAYNVAAAGLL